MEAGFCTCFKSLFLHQLEAVCVGGCTEIPVHRSCLLLKEEFHLAPDSKVKTISTHNYHEDSTKSILLFELEKNEAEIAEQIQAGNKNKNKGCTSGQGREGGMVEKP